MKATHTIDGEKVTIQGTLPTGKPNRFRCGIQDSKKRTKPYTYIKEKSANAWWERLQPLKRRMTRKDQVNRYVWD